MVAAFDDPAMVEYHDHVRITDSGQPVRDYKHRATLHQGVHTCLHDFLGTGVDRAGRFVQNHGGRVRHGGARNRNQLALALRQTGTVAGKHGVVPFRQHTDEPVGVRQLRSLDALLVGRVKTSVANVVHHRAGE